MVTAAPDAPGSRSGASGGLGEIEIIERFFAPLCRNAPGALALKDDAAILTPPPGFDLVVTSDMIVEGVHFFGDDAAGDIACKALGVNLSDLAAKGAEPLAYNLNIALPGAPQADWLAAFAGGLDSCQQAFGITLTGGDTTASPGPLMIAVTAFGLVPAGGMIRREGARPGDSVYVSGTIGDAFLGLKIRRGDADAAPWELEPEARDVLLRRYLRPEPRLGLRAALRAWASAALDVSDGLLLDFSRLCRVSGVCGVIEEDKVPLSHGARRLTMRHTKLLRELLVGGDDYEILCSVTGGREPLFEEAAAAGGVAVKKIGKIVSWGEGVALAGSEGAPATPGRMGYEHFRRDHESGDLLRRIGDESASARETSS